MSIAKRPALLFRRADTVLSPPDRQTGGIPPVCLKRI